VGNGKEIELDFEGILINRFSETMAFVFVHRDTCANQTVNLFAIEEFVAHHVLRVTP
jgi:hypothetical protein